MDSLIEQAIHTRKLLRITIQGRSYIAEPYSYGKAWSGQEVVRTFVIQSTQESTVPKGWHLFPFADIEKIDILSTSFTGMRIYDAYDIEIFCIYSRIENAVFLPTVSIRPCEKNISCLFQGACACTATKCTESSN